MDSTILIIGAGTFGVSTAWHLSQNHSDPSKVTIIDREASPPPHSAAADVNRIITSDYTSPLYAKMAQEALSFWSEDPDLEWYFHKVGRLVLDEEEDYIRRNSQNAQHTGSTQDIDLEEVEKRWEVLHGTDMRAIKAAYLDTEAGWIESANATWQFLQTAVRRRVKQEVGDVAELIVDKSNKTVRGVRTTDGRTFLADTVVIATGAWTSALLSPVEDFLNIADEDRIERQAQATSAISAYYPVSGEGLKMMNGCKMPCISYGQAGEVVPTSRDKKLLRYTNLKRTIVNTVTTSSGRSISVPPVGRSQDDIPQEAKVYMEDTLTTRLMPKFSKVNPRWRMCWDNLTPTGDMLLCEHPQVKNLFVITGGSFHSYKFMPNIGKYMVNVLKRQSNGQEMDKAWGWKSPGDIGAALNRGEMERIELNSLKTDRVSRL